MSTLASAQTFGEDERRQRVNVSDTCNGVSWAIPPFILTIIKILNYIA
jgi:hypothetical protein